MDPPDTALAASIKRRCFDSRVYFGPRLSHLVPVVGYKRGQPPLTDGGNTDVAREKTSYPFLSGVRIHPLVTG
jgi:hypothetical protein